MSIWEMTGAELSEACAEATPRYPGASAPLAAVLTGITALSTVDRAKLAAAFKAAEPAKQARISGSAFRSWDDWHPVWRAACQVAAAEHGTQWHLHPETLNGRIPAAWANIKLPIGATKHGPRDVHIPAARHWPGGVLPCGPEYAARGPLDASGDLSRGPMPAQAWREKWQRENVRPWPLQRRAELVMEPTPECIDDLAEAAD